MCGRFDLTLPAEALAALFGVDWRANLAPRYNIAPTQDSAVCLIDKGARRLGMARWGLVPHWAKDAAIGNKLINARAETLSEKASFRDSFAKRRCVVPATGFFEWKTEDGRKQPHRITTEDGTPLLFAGLWAVWRGGETPLVSFTIVTRNAKGPITALHHRMPAMLPAEGVDAWLLGTSDDARDCLSLAPPALRHYPVTPAMNKPAFDEPAALEPVGEGSPEIIVRQ